MPSWRMPVSTTRWRAMPFSIEYTTLPAGRSTTLCSGTISAPSSWLVTMRALTVPPPRNSAPSPRILTIASSARLLTPSVGLDLVDARLQQALGRRRRRQHHLEAGLDARGRGFRQQQVHAQLLHADQLEQRVAQLDVVADRDDLRFDLAVDRRHHARLGHAAAGLLAARPCRGELLAQGVALRDRVVDRVLRDEALADELAVALDHALLLLEQAGQAADFRLVARAPGCGSRQRRSRRAARPWRLSCR